MRRGVRLRARERATPGLPLHALLLAALAALACEGCTARSVGSLGTAPALLTKDDVLLVDQRRLTLTDYLALRGQLPGASTDEVVWTAAAIFALQQEWRSQGRTLDPRAALKLVREAQGESKRHLEDLLSHAVVQRNEHVLKSLPETPVESYKK